MKLLFLCLFSFSLLASSNSLDCPTWDNLFSEIYAQEGGITDLNFFNEYDEPSFVISCKEVDSIGEMIEKINSFVSPHLLISEEIILNIEEDFNNAYFGGGHLNIPMKLVFSGYSKHPKFTKNVWAHEYGHAIFERNVIEDIPFLKKNFEDSKIAVKLAIKSKRLGVILKSEKDLIKKELLKAQISKIDEEINSIIFGEDPPTEYDKKVERYNEIKAYYNELFADVIAVFYDKDPQAVSDALNVTGYIEQRNHSHIHSVHARDFTERSNRIDNWKIDESIHGYYAPTRFHIYQKYLKRPAILNNPGPTIKKIYDAIIIDFKRKVKDDHKELNPLKDNIKLIELINKQSS